MEKQKFKRNVYSHDDSGKVFLLAIILPFILSFLFSLLGEEIASLQGYEYEKVVSNIWFNLGYSICQVALFVGLWRVYSKLKDISPSAINFRPKQKWHTYLIVIALAIVALFGLQYIVSAFEKLIEVMGYPISQDFGAVDPENVGEYIFAIFTLAVIPAFGEELIFRGMIFNGLRERFKDGWAIIISAVMFALMHQNLQQLIYPILFGCLLAWIVLKTGSIFMSMLIHFTNNFLVVTFRFILNKTGFSFALPNTWWFYLIAVGLAMLAIFICYLVDRFYFKRKCFEEVEKKSVQTSKYIYISLAVGVVMFALNTILYVISP